MNGLNHPAALRAATRSRGYLLFAHAFDYPDAELLESIRRGELADALESVLSALQGASAPRLDRAALRDAGDGETLQVEYTRLFDVGPAGPPCPLHGGMYGGARMKTMEEAVRFYNHFGLRLSEEQQELPDHLYTELEFLHYLAYREAEVIDAGGDAGPYRRAQRDFLERHIGSWIPELRARLERESPPAFFAGLVAALESFLEVARLELSALDSRPAHSTH